MLAQPIADAVEQAKRRFDETAEAALKLARVGSDAAAWEAAMRAHADAYLALRSALALQADRRAGVR